MSSDNSVTATLASVFAVLGALVLFCLLFTAFLLIPLFIFLIAVAALMISEWSRKAKNESPASPTETALPVAKR